MRKIDDERYAQKLLEMSQSDGSKLTSPQRRGCDVSVAIWMAEEIRRQAQELHVDADTSRQLRERSEEILRKASAFRAH